MTKRLNILLLINFLFIAYFFLTELASPKTQPFFGRYSTSTTPIVGEVFDIIIPVELSNSLFKQSFYMFNDEQASKHELVLNNNVLRCRTRFNTAGRHQLTIYYKTYNYSYSESFFIDIKDNKPQLELSYYTDKNNIYVNAINEELYRSYQFSFDDQIITTDKPFISFKLPKTYGLYHINLKIQTANNQAYEYKKLFTKSYTPIDLSLNLNQSNKMMMQINDQAHFNFRIVNQIKQVSPYPENLDKSKSTKTDFLANKPDSPHESGLLKRNLDTDHSNYVDSAIVQVKLSTTSLKADDMINLYTTEKIKTTNFEIAERSILQCKVHYLNEKYFLEPFYIIHNESNDIYDINGTIFYNESEQFEINDLGKKTLSMVAHIKIVY